MAIKRFNDYDKTKAYSDAKQLPKGGYVVIIQKATVMENQNGQYIDLLCDIAEGEHKNFFVEDYKAQSGEDKKWHCHFLLNVPNDDGSEKDGWTKRRFKTFTEALEDSNSGYHFDWDEQKFKGKLIGGLFNMRQYQKNDGSVGESTNFAQVCSVDKIRKGDFKLPADKLLNNMSRPKPAAAIVSEDFMSIPDGADETLPF